MCEMTEGLNEKHSLHTDIRESFLVFAEAERHGPDGCFNQGPGEKRPHYLRRLVRRPTPTPPAFLRARQPDRRITMLSVAREGFDFKSDVLFETEEKGCQVQGTVVVMVRRSSVQNVNVENLQEISII